MEAYASSVGGSNLQESARSRVRAAPAVAPADVTDGLPNLEWARENVNAAGAFFEP
ncbi:hypothetical protein [Polyangium sp. 15x6]|uniref:hypothetical protein n=1 Tax=Polyangium sp. 15x6 TaxID=3042687 RepID=UPI00249A9B70|nr:hypothetical protein [Polyangium sp. 15x6]MDI3286009.1 hypothetical protein [Polyangium sp. 15x6]